MEISSFGSICSGIGTQEMAIKRVFPDIDIKYYSEIDKYSINSYKAIHGEVKNLGDFTKATDIPYVDFMFASTPCQDFSMAGKQAGFEGMRGTLTFEWVKMLKMLRQTNKLPKVIGFENVPSIMNKKFIKGFNLFQFQLKELGYNLFIQKLNSKDFNVPQSRNRVFLVGFLDRAYFSFPNTIGLNLKLKDVLEETVDEKFYLSAKQAERIHTTNYEMGQRRIQKKDWCDTLCARDFKDPKCIVEKKKTFVSTKYKDFIDNKGYIPKLFNPYNSKEVDKISPTLTTQCGSTTSSATVLKYEPPLRIRKLTPKECWRLMGMKDSDFEKAQEVNSNTQLYKQAGNAIVVDVLEHIFLKIKEL